MADVRLGRRGAIGLLAIVGLGGFGCSSTGDSSTPLAFLEAPEGLVSLSADVQPILDANCICCHSTAASCWVPGRPAASLSLEPEDLFSYVPGALDNGAVGVPSSVVPTLTRIVAGSPDDSYLVAKIEGTQTEVGGVGQRMPLGGSPLSDGEIELIRSWIEQGALDN